MSFGRPHIRGWIALLYSLGVTLSLLMSVVGAHSGENPLRGLGSAVAKHHPAPPSPKPSAHHQEPHVQRPDGSDEPSVTLTTKLTETGIPEASNISRSLHQIDKEPKLSLSAEGRLFMQVGGASSERIGLEAFLSSTAVQGNSGRGVRVDETALTRPHELLLLSERGIRLYVRENIYDLEEKAVRVVKLPSGELETLVDYRPTLALSGEMFSARHTLSDIGAEELIDNMRVVLLADSRDTTQIGALRNVVGRKLFIPRNKQELDEYIQVNRGRFFVVVGHSEGDALKVQDFAGTDLFTVKLAELTQRIREAQSGILNLTCSVACNTKLSGPATDMTSSDVLDILRNIPSEGNLLQFMEKLSAKSRVPMVLRRDMHEGGSLVSEADRGRLASTRNASVPSASVAIRSVLPTRSPTDFIPTFFERPLLSEQEAGSESFRQAVGYVLWVVYAPFGIWCAVAILMLFSFQNPSRLINVVGELAGRNWSSPEEEKNSFLTSQSAMIWLGAYALLWTATFALIPFFGGLAILFHQTLGTVAILVASVCFTLVESPGRRAFFANWDGIVGMGA